MNSLTTQAILQLLTPERQEELFYALEMIVKPAEDSIQTKLSSLEDKYFDLVWVARRDADFVKDNVDAKAAYDRICAKYPDELLELQHPMTGDWAHGFNSGMLACTRLLHAYSLPHNFRDTWDHEVVMPTMTNIPFGFSSNPEMSAKLADLMKASTSTTTITSTLVPTIQPKKFEDEGIRAELNRTEEVKPRDVRNHVGTKFTLDDTDIPSQVGLLEFLARPRDNNEIQDYESSDDDDNFCSCGGGHGDHENLTFDPIRTKTTEIEFAESEFPMLDT